MTDGARVLKCVCVCVCVCVWVWVCVVELRGVEWVFVTAWVGGLVDVGVVL